MDSKVELGAESLFHSLGLAGSKFALFFIALRNYSVCKIHDGHRVTATNKELQVYMMHTATTYCRCLRWPALM